MSRKNDDDDTVDDDHKTATKDDIWSCQQQFIPLEIIILEIISKLPVRSLLRFKSVSKSCYSLISSSRFVDHHLNVYATDPNLTRHMIIFKSVANHNLMHCPLPPVLNNHSTLALDLTCCLDVVHESTTVVVGCCNGLVCVVIDEHRVFLCNPATRESNELPKPNSYSSEKVSFCYYGFGYDKCSRDYKVVAFLKVNHDDELGLDDSFVEVYSLRKRCWIRIEDFPGGISKDGPVKFVNGCLHKFGRYLISGLCYTTIVSLDLATEMFAGFLLPPNSGRVSFCTMALGALGERLCVFREHIGSHAEFWVMNEYGVRESWTKLASVPSAPGLIKIALPFFISTTGEILLEYDSRLALYDVKNNSFKYPEIRDIDCICGANIYIESLVSPHGHHRSEISL